jgi:hypothetical protein
MRPRGLSGAALALGTIGMAALRPASLTLALTGERWRRRDRDRKDDSRRSEHRVAPHGNPLVAGTNQRQLSLGQGSCQADARLSGQIL